MAPKAMPGREIFVEGTPKGWQAIEKVYGSGNYAGKTYVRWQGGIGNHRNVLSLKAALKLHAKDQGNDPDEAVRQYEQQKEEKKEAMAKAREEAGYLKGQKREEAIAAFRKLHDPLTGAVVCSLPGWRGESKLLEGCGQLCARYYDDEGRVYALLKDIEALFGMKLQAGEPIPDIEAARSNVQVDERGRVVNVARTENIVEELSYIAPREDARKRRKTHAPALRRATPEDYQELADFAVVRLPKGGGSQALRARGFEDAEAVERMAEEIRAKLVGRGFDQAELVYVMGGRADGTEQLVRNLVVVLGGIYYQRSEEFDDHPCYQKVSLSKQSPGQLLCQALHIFWSEERGAWKLGVLDEGKAGYAVCARSSSTPMEVDAKWSVLLPAAVPEPKPEEQSTQEAGH